MILYVARPDVWLASNWHPALVSDVTDLAEAFVICDCTWAWMDVVFSVHSYTADEAAVVLHQAGVISILNSTRASAEDAEVGKYKSNLLIRFQNLSYDVRSWDYYYQVWDSCNFLRNFP